MASCPAVEPSDIPTATPTQVQCLPAKKTGGTYTFRNGDHYVGTFSGDRMCDSIYTFSTGQTLQGHFERGLPSGKMIYTDHGISYNTTWSNGICVGITIA